MVEPNVQPKEPGLVQAHSGTLSSENQRLLAFLDELRNTPDDKGEAWWDEFRDFLRKNPIRLGRSGLD